MLKKLFIPVVSSSMIISACENKVDLKAEESAIMKTDSMWAASAANGKDIDKIVSYWSDDAVVLAPDQPPVKGKEALRQFVKESENIPGFSINWRSSEVNFSPDGKMAYMYGENVTTMNDSTGKKVFFPGRGYTVWRKDADGNWKCVVDVWNNPPAKK